MSKFNKIWGIGLSLVLLVSMLLVAFPVAAGTNSLSAKTGGDIPSTSGEFLAPGYELIDMAVSTDGETIYVAADDTGGVADKLFKSVNGGESWSEVSLPGAFATTLDMVAVAPDNEDVVVITDTTFLAYVSTNGGSSFSNMNAPGTITALHDVAISPLDGSTRYVALAGADAAGSMWYFNLGATAPSWVDAAVTVAGGWTATATVSPASFRAVEFSPNFPSDQILLAVSEDIAGANEVYYHVVSFNQKQWDGSIFTGYPVTLEDTAATFNAADISVDPEYLGGDESLRTVFIGASIMDTSAPAVEIGGIYRFKDTSMNQIYDNGVGINSVAWDGTNLAAGRYDTNDVYRSADALASSPTVNSSRSNKEIGINDAGNDEVIVRWAGNSGMLYGVKQGDASSFATSETNGLTFLEKGLINSALTTPLDFQIAYDESVQYVLAADGTTISLYRHDSSWNRVFVAADDGDDDMLARIAISDPNVVFLADQDETRMFYSEDGGMERWTQRTSRYDIQDLAVQDADIAYVANQGNDEVSKSTNAGFTWGTDVDTNAGGGTGYSLALIGEDQLLIGTTTGYVSYSSDGNASWTKISTQLNAAGNTVVTASGLEDGEHIWAAASAGTPRIERWTIGQSGDTWKNMAVPNAVGVTGDVQAGDIYTGIVYDSASPGILYALRADGTDSFLDRNIQPEASTPANGHWATDIEAGVDMDKDPRALWISRNASGQPNAWALNTTGAGATALFSATDILAPGSDPLSLASPAPDELVPMNPVRGIAEDVLVQWGRPGSGNYRYEVKITTDEAGNVAIQNHNTPLAAGTRTDAETVRVLMGPNQVGTQFVSFNPGANYYAWVRTVEPWFSQWQGGVEFQIGTLAASAPEPLSPQVGNEIASPRPAFSWTPTAGATQYQFQLAVNADMRAPLVDTTLGSTAFTAMEELNRDTTYYWRVRAVEPVQGDWSAVANFTVAPEAAPTQPPITITQVPPPEIVLPAPTITVPPPQEITIPPAPAPVQIVPVYIYVIIAIGAILVIVVIILIVRTRRP